MTTPRSNSRGQKSHAAKHEAIARRIAAFPTHQELEASPSLILDGGPFKPRWAVTAVLITHDDPMHASYFLGGDLAPAVAVRFHRSPDRRPVRMHFYDYAWAVLLSAPGGSLLLNANSRFGTTYVRFRLGFLKGQSLARDKGPVPLARLLMEADAYTAISHADKDHFNLMRHNLIAITGRRVSQTRHDVEESQLRLSGFNPLMREKLDDIWRHGHRLDQSPRDSSALAASGENPLVATS